MADEAFALSPIAARAAQPSEADYEAIKDAFMETSRGRWFLTEYARRNRNADTRMVLDAVARIEGALAQQKPSSGNEPAETLAKMLAAVEAGRTQAATALDRLSVEQTLAPSYKDIQTIRQIVWTLRECGTDLRMCDLFDAQARAIETSLDLLTAASPRKAVLDVFDDLLEELNQLAGDAAQASDIADAETAAPEEATADPAPVSMDPELAGTMPPRPDVNISMPAAADQPASTPTAIAPDLQAAPDVPTAAVASSVPADDPARSQDEVAHDEAVLDLIANEMAAPDPNECDEPHPSEASYPSEEFWTTVTETSPAQPAVPLRAATTALPTGNFLAQPSLGAAALASGAVRRQLHPSGSRFAAIHRMTQAEKVALFS